MEKIKFLGRTILDNLDNIIALLIGAYATWYGYTTNTHDLILPIISATISIIAFSLIRDRVNRKKLSQQVADLDIEINKISSRYSKSDSFFLTRNNLSALSKNLRDTKYTLDVSGASLSTICVSHIGVLEDLLTTDITVRILLSNPNNINLQESLSKRYIEAPTPEIHQNQVNNSIKTLRPLLNKYHKKKKLQVHLTDQVQLFSYIGKDINKDFGTIQVEFYLHNIGITNDPIFSLHPIYDKHWYEIFKSQFEILWNDSITIEL